MRSSARTLGDLTRRQAEVRNGATLLVFEGRRISYTDFNQSTNQVANGLIALGIKPGERVAYLGKNSDLYFELVFGAAKAGVVPIPINWRLAWPEIAYIIDDSEAAALFVEPEFVGPARAHLAERRCLRTVVMMDGAEPPWPNFARWRDEQSSRDPALAIRETDVAMQAYSSGTTGQPKGVMLSHANFAAELAAINWRDQGDDEVQLVSMPIAHVSGTLPFIFGMYKGWTNILMRQYEPGEALDLMVREQVTRVLLVPAALQMLVRHPRAREIDLSRLRQVLYGASPMPLSLLREAMSLLACDFVQVYGLTETCGAITELPPEDHTSESSDRMLSAGKALTGVEMAVADAEGKHLPPGEVGEIVTRSACNMVGYWKRPDATAATIDRNGWLHTGDIGRMDEDGYVYLLDRLKDMIITGGENVYPAEVENVLYAHLAIAEAAVVGVPDAEWGEAVKAIIVLRTGANATEAEILDWARERIAGFKLPKSVAFVPELPRNASGKVLRRLLREPYWEGRERRVN